MPKLILLLEVNYEREGVNKYEAVRAITKMIDENKGLLNVVEINVDDGKIHLKGARVLKIVNVVGERDDETGIPYPATIGG